MINLSGRTLSPTRFSYLERVLKGLEVLAKIDVYQNSRDDLTPKLNHQVLRRTTVTRFQKRGELKDSQALLRHSNATTTLCHYQKTLDESLIAGVEGWTRNCCSE